MSLYVAQDEVLGAKDDALVDMSQVPIDMSLVPRARRQGLRTLVKKYASVKCFVTENASKVLYGGAYKK